MLDDDRKCKGWCPIGGGIEFGETAENALRREIQEELGCSIQILKDPTICENIFEHHGVKGHEIVFAFPIIFDDPKIYTKNRWQIFEHNDAISWVEWIQIDDFLLGKATLFPKSLLNKIVDII